MSEGEAQFAALKNIGLLRVNVHNLAAKVIIICLQTYIHYSLFNYFCLLFVSVTTCGHRPNATAAAGGAGGEEE